MLILELLLLLRRPIPYSFLILIFAFIAVKEAHTQSIDHWETVVMAGDTWSYFQGESEPPSGWNNTSFDDSSWLNGPGGIGYGDGDDATIINPVISLYLRIRFNISDTAAISLALLHVDFDDGFVAYLNGHEIARANLGGPGEPTPYNQFAIVSTYEAQLPLGGTPARFFVDKSALSASLNQGENVLSLQVHNCDGSSSDLSSTTFFSAGINNSTLNYRPTPQWFNDPLAESSHLPLIVIDTRGQTITDNPKVNVRLKVIDNGPGNLNNQFQSGTDYDGFAGIEVRGQSSQMFPKKGYSLELRDETFADTSVALLGMPEEEDWVLYAPFSDKTLMRNALTFYLGGKMGEWQPKTRFCELFINGDYSGIYALTENVKRGNERVDISKLKPDEISGDDLTGGYIVKSDKIDGASPGEYFTLNPSIRFPGEVTYNFTFVYPPYNEIVNEQKSYIIKYLTDTENSINGNQFTDPVQGFRKYIDVHSFVDFQIMQELTNNVDGYRFSCYFFKDKDSKGGKLHAGPLWDFDLCYGNEDFTDFNLETDIWLYTKFEDMYGGRIHWWARLMQDLSYRTVFLNRWKELRKLSFNTDSIMDFLDNSVLHLGEALDRNFKKWPVIGTYVWPNYFVGNTYEEEMDYLKTWITARVNWMDANAAVAENVSEDFSKQEILVYPNPVRDNANIYLYLNRSSDLHIEIYDIMGRKVLYEQFSPEDIGYQNFTLSLVTLSPGYYIMNVLQDNVRIGRKNIIVTGN